MLQMEFGEIKDVVRAKKPQRLPVVFTKEEIKVIIQKRAGTPFVQPGLFRDPVFAKQAKNSADYRLVHGTDTRDEKQAG